MCTYLHSGKATSFYVNITKHFPEFVQRKKKNKERNQKTVSSALVAMKNSIVADTKQCT